MTRIPKEGKNALKIKPVTERYLFNLQLIYTSLRERSVWDAFFSYVLNYAKSFTLKGNTGKVYLPPDQIQDKVVNLTSKFMEKYLKSSEYKVEASFGGILERKAFEALHGEKDEELCLSLNNVLGDEDRDMETTKGLKMTSVFHQDESLEHAEEVIIKKLTNKSVVEKYSDLLDIAKGYMLAANLSPRSAAKASIAARMIVFSRVVNPRTTIQWERKLFKDLNLSNRQKTAVRLFKTELFKLINSSEI